MNRVTLNYYSFVIQSYHLAFVEVTFSAQVELKVWGDVSFCCVDGTDYTIDA